MGPAVIRVFSAIGLLGASMLPIAGCTIPPNVSLAGENVLHARAVPNGSLRVGQVMSVGTREQLMKNSFIVEALTVAAKVPAEKIRDGTVVIVHTFCCGGPSFAAGGLQVYVPEGMKAEVGDIIEIWSDRVRPGNHVGIPPQPNTMTRRVEQAGSPNKRCRWVPDNPSLWGRVLYCDWMEADGWTQQKIEMAPFWIKPIAAASPPLRK